MRLILLVLCLSVLAPAQVRRRPAAKSQPPAAQPAQPSRWPIQTISIQGVQNYTREQALTVAGIRTGQPVGRDELAAAKDKLVACGAFLSVNLEFKPSADAKGYAVAIELEEAGPFFPVKFEDLPLPDAELLGALKRSDPLFGPRIPATNALLARYTQVLQDFLASKGLPGKLISRMAPDGPEGVTVLFRPAVNPPSVAQIRFTNNQTIKEEELEKTIHEVAVGLVYREPRFRDILEASIRPLYEAQGRVKVAFPEIQAKPLGGDVKGLLVTVKVEEGPVYKLGNVGVDGIQMSSEQVLKIGQFKPGQTFDLREVRAGVGRLEKQLRHIGYMDVKSSVERKVRDAAKTVDLTVHFTPGPQYQFGKLTVQGLDLNSEPVVRKKWALKTGDPFNADYPEYFLQRIREDGVFEELGKTKSRLDTRQDSRVVDVTLIFSPVEKKAEPKPEPW